MIETKSEIESLWHFWNSCYLNRIHPRIGIKHQGNFSDTIKCDMCKKDVPFHKSKRYRYRPRSKSSIRGCFLCEDCYKVHLAEFRKKKEDELSNKLYYMSEERQNRVKDAIESIEKFDDLMTNCRYGTCDIFTAHHELLKDDPNRLSTEFLIGLVCGEKKKKEYVISKNASV